MNTFKKIAAFFGLFVFVIVGTSCVQVEEEDVFEHTYTNYFYNFSISFPKELEYCVSDYCDNKIDDRYVEYFKIDGFQLLKFKGEEARKGVPSLVYLEIYPRKNMLGMSALEFGRRSLSLNREFSDAFYHSEGETEFAGEKAYFFITDNSFEQRGVKSVFSDEGEPALKDVPDDLEKLAEGRSLELPHKILYFDHDGVIYRIMYPVGDDLVDQIIGSFKWISVS